SRRKAVASRQNLVAGRKSPSQVVGKASQRGGRASQLEKQASQMVGRASQPGEWPSQGERKVSQAAVGLLRSTLRCPSTTSL
ncbi:MAG: hypothetical protein WCK57_11545, partial [Verrucomicrobiae bacterium]